MSLTKSRGDSNAASKGGDTAAPSGDAGELGYTKFPFPTEKPAMSNADVTITSGSKFADQQGTNLDSYSHQPAKTDAKTGAQLAEDWRECGYRLIKPADENPSRSPADTAKTANKTLGDTRAGLAMDNAQDIGECQKKDKDAGK